VAHNLKSPLDGEAAMRADQNHHRCQSIPGRFNRQIEVTSYAANRIAMAPIAKKNASALSQLRYFSRACSRDREGGREQAGQ
jgi:hypothetical protein